MKNEFEVAFREISESRSLPADIVLEALQTALVSAYRRDANASAAQRVEATIDPDTGRARIFVEKEVVDSVVNPGTEVDLENARYYEPESNMGDTVMVKVEGTTKKFGRIAAQTAKQVILQKIREAERNTLYEEFVEKEGDVIHGQVQSINSAVVTVTLGRAEAILPRAQQIPKERYKPHDKIRVYVMEVKKTNRGPQIIVSRSHRNMLRRLLEFEVPEIYNNQIEIKNIAREAGYRSKVAVSALQEGIDPVGACVGMRGIRIQNIVKELHDEKIDVIEWNPNHELFIEKALSPARVTGVYLDDDPDEGRTAVVLVPDDQLSLAIGREGQNARLAAKLTGWRIDIKSVSEAVMTALDQLDQPPLEDLIISHGQMLEEVTTIIGKKQAGRAVMPEEYRTLNQFADLVERRLQEQREEARRARLEEINAVKMTLPQFAFDISVQRLNLPDSMIEALQPLENVGEIMLRFFIDENRLRRMLGNTTDNALDKLQTALDEVMMAEDDPSLLLDELEASAEAEAMPAETSVQVAEDVQPRVTEVDETEAVAPAMPDAVVDVAEDAVFNEVEEAPEEAPMEPAEPIEPIEAFPDLPPAFEDPEPKPQEEAPVAHVARSTTPQPQPVNDMEDDYEYQDIYEDNLDDDDDDDNERGKSKKKRKKERQKRRQLVYDENTGQTIAKRRRKGSRKRESWDDIEY